jgi:hypothetical protein
MDVTAGTFSLPLRWLFPISADSIGEFVLDD